MTIYTFFKFHAAASTSGQTQLGHTSNLRAERFHGSLITSRDAYTCGYSFETIAIDLFVFLLLLVILSPSGTVSVCQGDVLTITCNVTGSAVLGWTYNEGPATSFRAGDTDPQHIASFNFTLLSDDNDTLISVASTNVSAATNGTNLECMNTAFITGSSIRRHINFNVKRKIYLNNMTHDGALILQYKKGPTCRLRACGCEDIHSQRQKKAQNE